MDNKKIITLIGILINLILAVFCFLIKDYIFLFIFPFLAYSLIRNEKVYEFRKKIIKEVFSDPMDYQKRFQEFDQVSYDEMFWKFWKPLNSFYPTLGKEDK